MGRVFHQASRKANVYGRNLFRDFLDLLRLIFRRGVASAVLEVRFYGTEKRFTADRRGYFQVHFAFRHNSLPRRRWHPVHLDLIRPARKKGRAQGQIFIPPPTARFAVISDIDDTVVYTGVANKLLMIWRLFFQNARTRTAFPGVAALYRALHRGVSGDEQNPLLYVSRGPWSIYEVLEEFFQHHEIPVGPILFLRDWNLAIHRPLPPRAKGHKRALISRMLSFYPHLPFILIGDSGQRDPEIYLDVVRDFPGRVRSIYIRKVGQDPRRDRTIENIAREVNSAGSELILASDSFDMATHAADRAYISPAALSDVLNVRQRQAARD